MACTYTINGKQYNDTEVKQVFSSILAVPGNENLSNDELVQKISELTKDRFVNINLFTPYQETAYTNIIFSEIIKRLGILKPGEEIRIKPNELFSKIKVAFENDYKRLNFLLEKIPSEEAYNELKNNESVVAKFPEVATLSYEQLKNTVEQFKNIIDPENFTKFSDMARAKLARLGLKISNNKIEDFGLSYEYYMNLAEEDAEDNEEEVEEDERQMDESFEDGRAFRINVKDTASTRVKLLFSTIPNTEKNVFGKNDFVPYDQVFEDLLQIGSSLTTLNYNTLQKELLERSKVKPYLRNVANKLAQLQDQKNIQLLNEVMTVINKAFTDHVLVLWNGSRDTGVKVKIISSNRDSVLNQIKQDWLENQKRSEIISKDETGELVVNKDRVAELAKALVDANKSKQASDKIFFMQEFFKAVGIEFTPKMLDYVKESANRGFFRMMGGGSFAAMFRPNGVFDRVLKTYAKEPEGKTDAKYDDVNNAMLHERVFTRFAEVYFQFHGDKYQTGSFRNGENKTIYSYINLSYLETVKKKLASGAEFLNQLAGRSFSKSSEVVDELTKNLTRDGSFFTYRLRYADSLKRDKEDKDAKVRKRMSPKEMTFDAIIKHQNGTTGVGFYNMFTLSDKTVTPVIEITKDSITTGTDVAINANENVRLRDSFGFKRSFSDKLYRLAESEINRVLDFAQYENKDNIGINLFEKSSKLFFLFPALNNKEDAQLSDIRNRLFQGIAPSDADKEYMAKVITDSFKENILQSFVKMVDQGLIEKKEILDSTTGKKNISFEYPFFNDDYMDRFKNLSSRHKGIMAIADFKYNYLRAQINTLQVLGADPSLFFTPKINKLSNNKTYEQLSTAEINKMVIATMEEFGKRSAMFIAPGSQGVWEWIDLNGQPVDRSSYNTITLADVVKNTAAFKGVQTTDAQELVTVQEHIDRLMSEGRMPLEIWQRMTDKIMKSKGKFYQFDNEELDIILQPTKPVHSSNTAIDGFTRIDYVKSSTYPLIPEVIQGTELDKLRMLMENNDIRSANFESAKKTGTPGQPLSVFDAETGDFIEPTDQELRDVTQTLTREGLRTQQEIPTQKKEINVVSQMDRQLFEGLLEVKDFELDGKKFSGRELKKLKEDIRIALFYKNQEELQDRMNIKVVGDKVIFKDQRALAALLQEEAVERDFDINDIKAIKVNKQGNLIVPVYLMAKGKRFEGLVTSIFSKLVKLKVPGTSLVQVSGVGSKTTRLEEGELADSVKNQIIYTSAYDPAKGLQYLRKEKNQVEAAQVFISQYIRDENGKLIDMSKLATRDDSGRLILDPTKLSDNVLQLIGARIPNQGHSSMLPIIVAGFLPAYMENTVIVPDGITAQMGSDFDVDKLYAYISVLKYNYSAENQKKLNDFNQQITDLKKEYDDKVAALYDDVYPADIRKKILDLKEKKNKYVEKLKYVGLSQKERDNKQKRIDGINKILEETYAAAMQETNEERFKEANQKKFELKEKLSRDIEKVRNDIEQVQGDVESIDNFSYSVSGYNNDYESLLSMSDSELLQMYKDLHWSVLTNKATFSKIVRSIDFEDIKSEGKIFEDNKLLEEPVNYLPMDVETQIQNFIDNRAGKQGTGIFAQLISFLAEHQDKDVFVGKVMSDGSKMITPVKLLKDDGTSLDLYKLTAEGKTQSPFGTRSKTDNTSIMLSESVDNTKNKNLYKFDFSVEAMTPLRALISLSSEDNEIADLRYATRLFPQQIIKEYTAELESRRDSLNDNTFVDKKALVAEIKNKYISMMSSQNQDDFKSGKLVKKVFNPKMLLDSLIEGKNYGKQAIKNKVAGKSFTPELQERLDSYILDQVSLLELYQQLDDLGQEMSSIMNASNVISSGVGNSLFAVAEKQRKIGVLSNARRNSNFLGKEEILGTVTDDGYIIEPKGQAGHAMKVAVQFGVEVLSQLAPLHFSPRFNEIREKVVREKSATGNIKFYGKQKYITLSEDLMLNMYSYIFTNPDLGIINDVSAERERLLFGNKDEKPLAVRILEAKESHKFLQSNYFINRLKLVIPSKTKFADPYLIQYRAPFSQDIDELANNKGFLELILSGDQELIDIARDLIKYPFVTGYNQSYSSYLRYIPVEVFMLNDKYMQAMQKFPQMFTRPDMFYKQFMQNNPDYARRVPSKVFNALFAKRLSDDATIVMDPSKVDEQVLNKLKVQASYDQGNEMKYPDYLSYYDYKVKRWFLFEKQGLDDQDGGLTSTEYKRIGTLGNGVVSEYNSSTPQAQSAFFNNLLYNEKFERLSSNPDNPYRKVKLFNIDRFRQQIAMAEEATQLIATNINNKSGVIKASQEAYKGKVNTAKYTAEDVVMIAGNVLTDVVSTDQEKLDVATTVEAYRILEDIFKQSYVPFIDAAIEAGADIVLTNFSGMDQLAKKYLQDKGLTESQSDMGYIKFVNPKHSEPAAVDEDFDVTDEPDDIDFNAADFDAPAIDLFGIGTAEPEVEEAGGVFSISDAIQDDRDSVIPTFEVEEKETIDTEKDVLNRYLPKPDRPTKLKSVLTKFSKTTNNEFYKTMIKVFDKVGYPDINVVVDEEMIDPGQYDMTNKVILINPGEAMNDNPSKSFEQNFEDVLMHEVIHGYTADIIQKAKINSPGLNENQRMYYASLRQLYRNVVGKVINDPVHGLKLKAVNDKINLQDPDDVPYLTPEDKSMYYGLTSLEEFVSMILTDKGFQKFMNETIVNEGKELSAFESFKRLLLKLFRTLAETLGFKIVSGSALEQGINDTFNLITSIDPNAVDLTTSPQLPLFSVNTNSLQKYSLDTQCK